MVGWRTDFLRGASASGLTGVGRSEVVVWFSAPFLGSLAEMGMFEAVGIGDSVEEVMVAVKTEV